MAPFLRLARHGRYVIAARQVLYCGFAARRALAGWLDGELSLHALCGRQIFVSHAYASYGRRHPLLQINILLVYVCIWFSFLERDQ